MNYIEDRKKIEGALLIKMSQDKEFEKTLLADPGDTLKQLGFEIPSIKINIMREKDGEFLLVIPEDLPEGEVGKMEMAMVSGGAGIEAFIAGIVFLGSFGTTYMKPDGIKQTDQGSVVTSSAAPTGSNIFEAIFSSAW